MVTEIRVRIKGMVEAGAFTWVGCADAVRAELLKLPGVLEVAYDAAADYFTVRYEAVVANLEIMFGAIFQAGRMMGKEYFPEVVEAPPPV